MAKMMLPRARARIYKYGVVGADGKCLVGWSFFRTFASELWGLVMCGADGMGCVWCKKMLVLD